MKRFIRFITSLIGLLKKGWLFLRNKNPEIIFLKANYPLAINDLPLIIQWKTRYCYKAEIIGIGPVKTNGLLILNNYRQHQSVQLKIWGKRKTIATRLLILNHKSFPLQPHLNNLLHHTSLPGNKKLEGSISALETQIENAQQLVRQEFINKEKNNAQASSLFPANTPALLVPLDNILQQIASIEKQQQQFFIKEYQLQNPENFTSTNLYQ